MGRSRAAGSSVRAGEAWITRPRERTHDHPQGPPLFRPAAAADPMSEDERLELLATVAEAHAALSDIALALRRRLTSKAPATKAAVKVEQEAFRLKRELGRLDLTEPDPAPRRGPLPEVRRGGKVIDIERLRRGKDRGGER